MPTVARLASEVSFYSCSLGDRVVLKDAPEGTIPRMYNLLFRRRPPGYCIAGIHV